jgi:hypothetical protein
MEYPFLLSYTTKTGEEDNIKIGFTLWSPFTKDTEYRVPYTQVVSIGFPKESIEEKYIEMVKPFNPDIDKTIQQLEGAEEE